MSYRHTRLFLDVEGGGAGLTCSSFFFQTTQNAVVDLRSVCSVGKY